MNSLLLLTLYWPSVYLGVSIGLGLIATAIVALTCRHKTMFRRKLVLAFFTPATALAAAFFSIFISGMVVGYFLHADDRHQSELQTELSRDYELRASDFEHLSNAIYSKNNDSIQVANVDSVMVIGDTIVGKSKEGYFVIDPDNDKPKYYPSI